MGLFGPFFLPTRYKPGHGRVCQGYAELVYVRAAGIDTDAGYIGPEGLLANYRVHDRGESEDAATGADHGFPVALDIPGHTQARHDSFFCPV